MNRTLIALVAVLAIGGLSACDTIGKGKGKAPPPPPVEEPAVIK